MKIGILTYHSVYNFGANLQAYSTVGYLQKKGHKPYVINWIPEELEKGYDRSNPEVQAMAHKEFISRYLPTTRLCRNEMDIVKVIEENHLEAIIIGSDAVLQHHSFLSRIRITRKGIRLKEKRSNTIFPNPFWGSFIPLLKKEIPVLLMSVSSQNTNYKIIKGKLKQEIRIALERFNKITVRDEWTRKMIKYFTEGELDPEITPDPVFSFNNNIKSFYDEKEICNMFSLPEKYLLLSFKNDNTVTSEWLKEFKAISLKNGITPVLLTMPRGLVIDVPFIQKINIPVSPDQWYALIKYSSGYVGENMHPIIVALHNIVPFFSFDDYGLRKFRYFVNEKSSKIYDILERATFLENRVSTLRRGYTPPSPNEIIERIKSFNYEKCKEFSQLQINKYNEMMEDLLNIL